MVLLPSPFPSGLLFRRSMAPRSKSAKRAKLTKRKLRTQPKRKVPTIRVLSVTDSLPIHVEEPVLLATPLQQLKAGFRVHGKTEGENHRAKVAIEMLCELLRR